MRALFLNPWDRLIGPNRFLVDVLSHAEGPTSRVVACPEEGPAAAEYRELGCEVVIWPDARLVHPRLAGLPRLAFVHILGLARVAYRLRRLAPDVVVTNSENVWVGGLAASLVGVPHVQVVHALTFARRLDDSPRPTRLYLRWLAARSRRLVAVSTAVAEALARGGVPRSMIRVVPNPVPGDPGRPARGPTSGPDLAGRRPVLLSAGRLSPMKGQDLLIEALPRIREQHPDVLCVFAGRRGSDAGFEDTAAFGRHLEGRIEELDLASHVLFLGETEELPSWLAAADVYVQPSRTESFGRVVAEALLAGTPAVAFAVGGLPETAGPGAVLVAPEDPAALAAAVLDTLAEPERARRRTAQGREHVAREFEPVRVARRFREVLDEAVREARG